MPAYLHTTGSAFFIKLPFLHKQSDLSPPLTEVLQELCAMLKALPLVLVRIALLFCLCIGQCARKRKLPAVSLAFSSLVSYELCSFSSFEGEKIPP